MKHKKITSDKKMFSSRQQKAVPDKKRIPNGKEDKSVFEIAAEQVKKDLEPMKQVIFASVLESNGSVRCKCGEKMEFYGVDGTGGLKFSCPKCYEKKNIKSDK